MDYKKLREEMTEQALSIENVLCDHPKITLGALCRACNISRAQAEFILQQMVVFLIIREASKGRFFLTDEYLIARA